SSSAPSGRGSWACTRAVQVVLTRRPKVTIIAEIVNLVIWASPLLDRLYPASPPSEGGSPSGLPPSAAPASCVAAASVPASWGRGFRYRLSSQAEETADMLKTKIQRFMVGLLFRVPFGLSAALRADLRFRARWRSGRRS